MTDNKQVYIIILNYNGYQDTIECLESLLFLEYPDFQVVVCDNASPNESEFYIKEWIRKHNDIRFHFIQTGKNLGFAGGNNIGIRYAMDQGADYIWLLNNDTVVKPDTLIELIRCVEKNKKIGICGSTLYSYFNKDEIASIGGYYNPVTGTTENIKDQYSILNLSYIVGASMLFRREVFEDVGLLQDDYFLYFEELDMAERIHGRYKMDVALNSIVYHKEGASIGNGSPLSEYFLLKNNLKFTWRFHRIYFPIIASRMILRIFHPFHKRSYKRLEMFLKVTKMFIKEISDKDFKNVPVYKK